MVARLLAFLFLFSTPALAQTTAIRAGNLVDPATGSVVKNQTILIKGKKIIGVGSGLRIPADAEVVDLSNAWVLPGLMDAHTHVTLGGLQMEQLEALYLRQTTGMRLLRGLRNAKSVLAVGQFADIMATPGNPLEDIRALHMAIFVMKEAKWSNAQVGSLLKKCHWLSF